MSFQVGQGCYDTAAQAAQVSALSHVGSVVALGSVAYEVDVSATDDTSITYVLNPVPVPNTNPQQYSQPGTRLTPAPSPSSPWQVDVAPDDQISTNPSPVLSPQAVPADQPASAPATSDICQLHPNIVACQTLGTLDPVAISDNPVGLAITEDTGWGAGAGACPAPQSGTFMGKPYSLTWQPFCTFASGIRPLVIALAWVSAAFGFFGLAGKSGNG